MATLIKDRRPALDSWQRLSRNQDGALPPLPERGKLIVPFALWLEQRAALLERGAPLGVWLDSH
jgi:uncharacterized protein (DUF934 family)